MLEWIRNWSQWCWRVEKAANGIPHSLLLGHPWKSIFIWITAADFYWTCNQHLINLIKPVIHRVWPASNWTPLCSSMCESHSEAIEPDMLWHWQWWSLQFSQALEENKTLKILFIQNNEVGEAGAKVFAEMLEKNQSLKKLSLYSRSVYPIQWSIHTDSCTWTQLYPGNVIPSSEVQPTRTCQE